MVGAGLGAGGADAAVFEKENGAGGLADHVYACLLPAVVGEHPAKNILGIQPLQNGSGGSGKGGKAGSYGRRV